MNKPESTRRGAIRRFVPAHGACRSGVVAAGVVTALAVAMGGLQLGCGGGSKARQPVSNAIPSKYEALPPKQVPQWLEGSVLQRVDVGNTGLVVVSGFGLVTNLPSTGDGTAPLAVREYMMKEMAKRGFGSVNQPGMEALTPERVLNDPLRRVAIVRVDAALPPGVRKGSMLDVQVSALPESEVTSLAGGVLYSTDLKVNGADPRDPSGKVNIMAQALGGARGRIFINPVLALNPQASAEASSSAGRRTGIIPDGAVCTTDRFITLRLRDPQASIARLIEARIDQYFQNPGVAAAQDEGIVRLYVPPRFKGDWERFVGVCTHLYFQSNPEFLSAKASELAREALQPDAPLMNISYAWEAMGPAAIRAITPLLDSKYSPEVRFAAARAAAFIGETSATAALLDIAQAEGHPFQVEAVRVLGALPASPSVNALLRRLLDSPGNLVRIEAYRVLAANRDPSIVSRVINEQFVLDIVPSKGAPFIYATRSGTPRIAIFGSGTELSLPTTFAAMDSRLTISGNTPDEGATIFYRGITSRQPAKVLSDPDVTEIIAWLGGMGDTSETYIDFSYGQVVAVVQALAEQGKLTAPFGGRNVTPTFVLQDSPAVEDVIDSAPALPQRPTGEQAAAPLEGRIDGSASANGSDPSADAPPLPARAVR